MSDVNKIVKDLNLLNVPKRDFGSFLIEYLCALNGDYRIECQDLNLVDEGEINYDFESRVIEIFSLTKYDLIEAMDIECILNQDDLSFLKGNLNHEKFYFLIVWDGKQDSYTTLNDIEGVFVNFEDAKNKVNEFIPKGYFCTE